jgi:hypothetical protein
LWKCANPRALEGIAMAQHIARKRFGQHFLTDGGIIDAIVQVISPRPGDPMVEIGPGLAALTQPLVERLGQLTVVELDRDLAARLRLHTQLDVIESDGQAMAGLAGFKGRLVSPPSRDDQETGEVAELLTTSAVPSPSV